MLFTLLTAAFAGTCDASVAAIETTPRDQLVDAYRKHVDCSKKSASKHFGSYTRAAGDVETLVDLSLQAIALEQFTPVWDMLGGLSDRKARTDVAERVGGLCQDNVAVLPFLQGGYFAANERSFTLWSEAFSTCGSEGLTAWMKERVADPPSRTYDAKYGAVLAASVERFGVDVLPILVRGAVVASERGGPFTSVLETMGDAVRPPVGQKMSDSQKARLADALVEVGQGGVRPEQAALVADRLYQQGFSERAAGLLKVVYGERVQSDGRLLYGVASVEHCGGQAVVHLASVTEPAKRWAIDEDVQKPMRAFKQRLKCDTNEPWPIFITRSPVATEADVLTHGDAIVDQYTSKKLATKLRREKPVVLD